MRKASLIAIITLLCSVAAAQVTYINSLESITVASSPATLTFPNVKIGDHLGGQLMETGTSNTLSVADTCGDTATTKVDTFASRRVLIFDFNVSCAGSVTLTGSQSGTATSSSFVAVQVRYTSGIDGTLWNSTNSLTGGNITTSAADYIAVFGTDGGTNGGVVTAGTGFTLRSGGTTAFCPSFACGYEDKQQSVAGAIQPTFNYTLSGSNFVTSTIPYKPIATSYTSFNPASLLFSAEIIGSTTAGQVITLTNVGGATLNITSIALQTGTSFTKSATTCGATLASAASCTVTVTFSPSASGNLKDNLVFTTDAPTSPDKIAVQGWGSILDPTRSIDWSHAGASIINRSTICANETASSSLATINADIASCAAAGGGVVKLAAGTYNLGAGEIIFNNASNVTVRGSGANSTFLVFTGAGNGNGLGAVVYAQGPDAQNNNPATPQNICTLSAGLAQGATSATISSCGTGSSGNLFVGSKINIDVANPGSDPGNIFFCNTTGNSGCTTEGPSGNTRSGRAQFQSVIVTAINGSTITFTPGIYAPNWGSASVQIWFASHPPVSNDGVENLSIDVTAITGNSNFGSVIMLAEAYNSWVTNVRVVRPSGNANAAHKGVWLYGADHITVQNSYFYGSAGASESYGVDSGFASSDNLIVNNICQQVSSCEIVEGDAGSVFAYNFAIDNLWTSDGTFQQLDCSAHGDGNQFTLWEGNQGAGCDFDEIHGPSFGLTTFRNYMNGRQSGRTTQTIPIQSWSLNRYANFIGNVLGTTSYHLTYQSNPASSTDCGNPATGNTTIFALGWSNLDAQRFAPLATCPSGFGASATQNNDLNVATSVMRWGNCDTVNAACRFVNGEVPSGISPYGNAIPGNHTLPASFYAPIEPSFFGVATYPAIGPDVTGGNTGFGGFANNIPAQICYTNIGGSADGTGSVLSFDAGTCYPVSGAATPTFSPGAGTYSSAQSVTISTTTPGAVICYNTTGSPSTNGSTGCDVGTLYSSPVSVAVSETLYAVAGGTGLTDSAVGSAAYVITATTPTCDHVSGTYSGSFANTCSTASGGTVILCWTSDSSTPITNGLGTACSHGTSLTNGSSTTISSTETFKIVAGTSTLGDSPVATYSYTITPASPGSMRTAGTIMTAGTVQQ